MPPNGILNEAMDEAREGFSDLSAEAIQQLVDEAVAEVRVSLGKS